MKKFILPITAAIIVIAAAVILIAVPKGGSSDNQTLQSDDGRVYIQASELSEDKITLLKVAEDSKVELVAIKDAQGTLRVALGTCQSCNGSPGAYYSQNGDLLQCNNCGLTFPLSIIGADGRGCHPIMLDESQIAETSTGISIDREYLLGFEALFANVAEH